MNLSSYKGPLVILVSSFIFACGYLTTKLASYEVSGEEVAFVRFAFGIIFTMIFILSGKAKIDSDKKMMLIARGLFGGLAIILLFVAISKGNVTNASVLNNTYPIFATIIAAYWLKEGLGSSKIIPLIFAFTGLVLLVHPSVGNLKFADVLGISSGICGGVSVVIIKELRKTQNSWSVFFYLSIFGTLFSAFLAFPKWVWPSQLGWLYLLTSAAFATAGQLLATWGYKYCSTATGSTVSMSTGLFSALIGVIFLGERLRGLEWFGLALLIISSTYLVAKPNKGKVTTQNRAVSGIND